jgi:outer membrane protein TolC
MSVRRIGGMWLGGRPRVRRALTAMLAIAMVVSGREWALDELVAEALRTSREIESVQSEMAKVDAQIREAYGSALPSITASANYQYAWESFNPTASLFDFGDLFGAGGTGDSPPSASSVLDTATATANEYALAAYIDTINAYSARAAQATAHAMDTIEFSLPHNTLVLGLSVQQPLYAQGKVSIGLRVAKKYKEGLLCKYEGARQKVKAEVTKLFYATLLAQEAIRIQNQAVTIARESHRLTIARFALGKSGEVDTFATRFAVEEAVMKARSAQSKYRVVCEAIVKQAGIPESADDFAVTGTFPDDGYRISLEDALNRMRSNNKNIGQLESGEAVQEELVKLQKSDYLPMVYCGAKLNKYLMFDSFDDIEWDVDQSADKAVFVGASYTLFNGLQRRQKVKQSLEDLRQFRLTKGGAEDGLEIAVRSTWEEMETSREQLASARSLVELARKGHALAQKAYEVGTSTRIELQKVENDLNGAQLALNAASFAFNSAVLDLKLLMGDITMGSASGPMHSDGESHE